jgi:hypothetical protein
MTTSTILLETRRVRSPNTHNDNGAILMGVFQLVFSKRNSEKSLRVSEVPFFFNSGVRRLSQLRLPLKVREKIPQLLLLLLYFFFQFLFPYRNYFFGFSAHFSNLRRVIRSRMSAEFVPPLDPLSGQPLLHTNNVATAVKPGLLTKATIATPQLRAPGLAVTVDVACCPGNVDWSCDCSLGRTVHPNKSQATSILRQWIVAEIPRGRKVVLPVSLPEVASLFKLTRPEDEPSESGCSLAISFFDVPVPCPPEVSMVFVF